MLKDKVFMSTDLEGVAGVVHGEYTHDGGEHDRARRLLNALTNLDPSRLSRPRALFVHKGIIVVFALSWETTQGFPIKVKAATANTKTPTIRRTRNIVCGIPMIRCSMS